MQRNALPAGTAPACADIEVNLDIRALMPVSKQRKWRDSSSIWDGLTPAIDPAA
jgi:hypothetical protein